MTILTREQIEEFASVRSRAYPNGGDAVADTLRAYHDLRDAVLALCDGSPDNGIGIAALHEADVREVVARVERGD